MSILKKVISLLLCVAMLIPVLASCDTGNSPNAEAYQNQIQEEVSDQTHSDTKEPVKTADETGTDTNPPEEIPDSPQPHTHTPASAVTENYVDSSCTQIGSYDIVVYCSECQEEISRTQNTINKKSHQYNQKVTTSSYLKSEATYTSSAVYYYSCTCGQRGTNTFSHGNPLLNNLTPTYSYTADYSFYVVTGVTGSGTTLEIPSIYDGLRVVAIAENAFKNNTTLTKVTLPNTIETIGQNAFSGCTALSEINLPEESVSSIGAYAFAGCTALKTISIPSKVTVLSEGVFQGCTKLKTVQLSDGLKTISNLAFDGCTALSTISIPNTVTSLGNMAFRHAEALTTVKLSTSLTAIGNATFQYCKSLSSVELHNKITTIGNSAFSYCYGLKTLRILGSISSWGNSTFYECTALENVYIEKSSTATVPSQNYIFYNASTAGNGIAFSYTCNITLPELLFVPNGNNNLPKFSERTAVHSYTTTWTNNTTQHWHVCQNSGCSAVSEKVSHTFGEWIVDTPATCVSTGTRHHVCTVCNKSVSETIHVNSTAHNYATIWSSDDTHHWHGCKNSGCSSVSVKTSHTFGEWIIDTPATCVSTGTRHHVCTVCNKSVSEIIPVDSTAHNYATTWTSDDTHHRHACQNNGCSSALNKESHSFGEWIVDTPATCVSTGTRHHVCTVCNKSVSEIIPVDSTAHNYATAWTSDDIHHWHACKTSGCSSVSGKTSHSFGEWIVDTPATCVSTGARHHICATCNSSVSATIPIDSTAHNYVTTWTSNDTHHWHACKTSGCSSVSGRASHSWNNENTCTGCQAYKDKGVRFSWDGNSSTYSVTDYTGSESTVVIPSSYKGRKVTSIGNEAFYGCSSLTSVTIGSSVASIGGAAFYNCSALTSVTIGNSVTSIGASAFYNCSSLTSVTIGNSVTSIDDYAFSGCSSLMSVTIPDSVTSIGKLAFMSCVGLKSITVEEGNTVFHSSGNCLIKTESKTLILGCMNSVIPKDGSVTSIDDYAFYSCTELTSIIIPNSVTSIGSMAFKGCNKLASITLPFVGEKADGTGKTYLGYIFGGSHWQKNEDYVPTSLKTVIITGDTSIYDYALYRCTGLTSVTILDSVTSIGRDAFFSCDGLTSIIIPDSVTSIGEGAFFACEGLISVTIGNGVTSIADEAFYACTRLTTVTIPNGVTKIGNRAFDGCTGLTSVTIGNSVTFIGRSAFDGCTGLTSIKYRGSESAWSKIEKGSYWNSDTGSYTITYNYTGE